MTPHTEAELRSDLERPKFKHCIVGIIDQYAEARGNFDVEYSICQMTNGKNKTFESDDLDFEAFCDDREAYWKKNGWTLTVKDRRNTLTPTTPQ